MRLWLILLVLSACAPRAVPPTYAILCDSVDVSGPLSVPCCNAFALNGRLATASHCVGAPGERVHVVTPTQWARTASASDWTSVVAVDDSRDFALLGPAPGALIEGEPLHVGEPVSALTLRGTLHGVAQEVSGAFYLTDLDVHLGDSGAPVLDVRGQVVAVVVACLASVNACAPNAGIVAGLP